MQRSWVRQLNPAVTSCRALPRAIAGTANRRANTPSGRAFSYAPRLPRSAAPLLLLILSLCLVPAPGCRTGKGTATDRAEAAWDSGDYQRAADEYERFLDQHPSGEASLAARFKLANIYYLNLHRYDQARSHYSEFLRQDSSHAEAALARERLAEVLGELGRTYEAISEYESMNPADPHERRRIRLRIAAAYYDQKNFSQALTEYQKVVERAEYDDLSEQAYMREASIYSSRNQYQQARDIYEKLAENTQEPKVRTRARFGLADCYAGLNQFDDAINILRAIHDDPEQPHINQRISELEQQKREATQARTGLQR